MSRGGAALLYLDCCTITGRNALMRSSSGNLTLANPGFDSVTNPNFKDMLQYNKKAPTWIRIGAIYEVRLTILTL